MNVGTASPNDRLQALTVFLTTLPNFTPVAQDMTTHANDGSKTISNSWLEIKAYISEKLDTSSQIDFRELHEGPAYTMLREEGRPPGVLEIFTVDRNCTKISMRGLSVSSTTLRTFFTSDLGTLPVLDVGADYGARQVLLVSVVLARNQPAADDRVISVNMILANLPENDPKNPSMSDDVSGILDTISSSGIPGSSSGTVGA